MARTVSPGSIRPLVMAARAWASLTKFQVPGTPVTVTFLMVLLPAGTRTGGSRNQTIRYDWNAEAVPSQMSHAALYCPGSAELHFQPVHSLSMVEYAAG